MVLSFALLFFEITVMWVREFARVDRAIKHVICLVAEDTLFLELIWNRHLGLLKPVRKFRPIVRIWLIFIHVTTQFLFAVLVVFLLGLFLSHFLLLLYYLLGLWHFYFVLLKHFFESFNRCRSYVQCLFLHCAWRPILALLEQICHCGDLLSWIHDSFVDFSTLTISYSFEEDGQILRPSKLISLHFVLLHADLNVDCLFKLLSVTVPEPISWLFLSATSHGNKVTEKDFKLRCIHWSQIKCSVMLFFFNH